MMNDASVLSLALGTISYLSSYNDKNSGMFRGGIVAACGAFGIIRGLHTQYHEGLSLSFRNVMPLAGNVCLLLTGGAMIAGADLENITPLCQEGILEDIPVCRLP